MLRRVVWKKSAEVSEMLTAATIRLIRESCNFRFSQCDMKVHRCFRSAIVLMLEAVSTSETSANFYQATQHNIPKDSHPHTRHPDNLNLTLPDRGSPAARKYLKQVTTASNTLLIHNLRPSFPCVIQSELLTVSLSKI
jgi:hypothetical protein